MTDFVVLYYLVPKFDTRNRNIPFLGVKIYLRFIFNCVTTHRLHNRPHEYKVTSVVETINFESFCSLPHPLHKFLQPERNVTCLSRGVKLCDLWNFHKGLEKVRRYCINKYLTTLTKLDSLVTPLISMQQ